MNTDLSVSPAVFHHNSILGRYTIEGAVLLASRKIWENSNGVIKRTVQDEMNELILALEQLIN